ncbi:NAD(P)H-hydrate dehydratase [Oscillatoria sp. FACHB-1407]|uniref:NAD(P)H-hydrate dehydratase n=1 Tax=Oscillatoria sp. FACHB-1407 TaxID=2692847 RepID=UPI001688135C|nr:NAD(P)H-hydrate dehydratase [Oscillatoria sp. FACHB-1407]MBD2462843.1 NAD(P)H-hydrate dehydratase [Oscillatoria sp. FACHB-1407]
MNPSHKALQRLDRTHYIQSVAVTTQQMMAIEGRVFAAGMPVAALMEKVAGLITRRLVALYPRLAIAQVGVLVGPGHNGGDALVVARELHFLGYTVLIYCPFNSLKELTQQHADYAASLGIPQVESVDELSGCDLIVDGLFGFGLSRNLEGTLAEAIATLNQLPIPIVSIDLPSGLHTDTGAVLGTAIRATRTLCLGLWKLAFLHDQALEYVGEAELIDFDLPVADIQAVLGETPDVQRLTASTAIATLPLPRHPTTHKYKQGHLLLVCGSGQYMGAAILAGLAARASGVGMLSIAVPDSLKSLLTGQLPDALVIGCPETKSGAIAHLPERVDVSQYQAIACGPGLTPDAIGVVRQVLAAPSPLVLDADGLNILATLGTLPTLAQRPTTTILTPHPGEFKRLFPDVDLSDRLIAARSAARQSGAIVLLKGARLAIANPQGTLWVNPESTPALARGGSGDVLTGLLGGLIAQIVATQYPVANQSIEKTVQTAVWWHAQAAILAKHNRTELGVDAFTLTHYLIRVLQPYFPS